MDTLRNYTFLPWTRQGIAAEIPDVDDLGAGSGPGTERAEVSVRFKVNGQEIAKQVTVLGPGDVIGINPRAIVKTEPRHWVTDFESNYLPYVEFYEEDFPWRFTPARAANSLAQSRLRPWLVLVVLKEEEFVEQPASRPLPAVEVAEGFEPASFFPGVEQSWAWAHVHVSQNVIGSVLQTTTEAQARGVEQNLEQALRTNADVASSRLLCPRKLEKNTAYHAFVVPAFETGRLAGLGLDIPEGTSGQLASWGGGQRVYPIYHRWFFRTGASGDFELLVDLLEPRPVDPRVGVREMDMQDPGYEVGGMSGDLRVMGLEGALKSPEMEPFPAQWPPAGTDFENPSPGSAGSFLNELETKVNLQLRLQQEESADNPHPDPIISPPLYGKWYAMVEELDAQEGTGWVDELNRDPRSRVPAGTGTQVIQKEQEKFMQQAWAQLGDLLRANQKIRQLQLSVMSTFAAYQKNVLPQQPDRLLAFTHAVQPRVLGSATTIAKQVRDSRLPQAALDPAFRKIARSRGAIMRKVVPVGATPPQEVLSKLNKGLLSAAPPPPEPTGQISLDGMAQTTLTAQVAQVAPPAQVTPPAPSSRLQPLGTTALAILAIASLLLMLAGFSLPAVILLGVGVAVLVGLELARRPQIDQTDPTDTPLPGGKLKGVSPTAFTEKSFQPLSIDKIPTRPDFVLTDYGVPMPRKDGGQADSAEAGNFRIALKDAFNVYQSPPPPRPVLQPMDLKSAVLKLQQSLNPAVTIPRRAEFVLKIPASIKNTYLRPRRTLVPVMAHPVFTEPMYRALRDISSEFLAPNLNLIPNNTISLMETNQRFIEAYMVGLNDEMGRELLWRQFPTDQRGSYFRQFWDVGDTVHRGPGAAPAQVEEELLDITKLHTWDRESALGTHANRPLPTGAEPGGARLVLVVRGDLLKKYPTTVVYAQKARWTTDSQGHIIRELDDSNPALFVKSPIFKAEIEPDVRFLGFDLTAGVAKGNPDPAAADPGWFFVLQERPGEPRFGLDDFSEESPERAANWNELAWEHLDNFATLGCIDLDAGVRTSTTMQTPDNQFAWGRNAADMAYILYQVPVMVAFHADDMLE